MVGFCLARNQNIINVYSDMCDALQETFHGFLKDARSGRDAERQTSVTKQALVCIYDYVLPGLCI